MFLLFAFQMSSSDILQGSGMFATFGQPALAQHLLRRAANINPIGT